MVAKDVNLLKFTPKGGVSITLRDWAYNVGALNVKDFGALGNGIHDDHPHIQACFDAAWGPYSAPRLDRYGNKPVYFPPGVFRVTHTLQLSRTTLGGWVRGAGSQFTIIKYEGAVPGDPAPYGLPGYNPGYGANATSLMRTDGFGAGRLEGFTLQMGGMTDGVGVMNSTTSHAACFNWDWYNDPGDPAAGVQGNSNIIFRDVYFKDATYGFLMSPNILTGSQGDNASFMNCGSENVWKCICTNHGNNVNNVVIGGYYKGSRGSDPVGNPGTPISCPGGNISSISGIVFEDNDYSVINTSQGLTSYSSLYSRDDNFIAHAGACSVIGCVHELGTGAFLQTAGTAGALVLGCYSEHGNFTGAGALSVVGTEFGLDPSALFTGSNPGLLELRTRLPLTFAQLPALVDTAEGLEFNISNANTAAWGSPVAGTGINHVLVGVSGNHAQADITFTAQPAENSTLTFDGETITFQNAYLKPGHWGIINRGSGGTDGTRTFTVLGGTGTPAQITATITAGQLASIGSVVVPGNYTVKPTNPASLSGTGLPTGATVSFDMGVDQIPGQYPTGVFRGSTLAECLTNLVELIKIRWGRRYTQRDVLAFVTGSVVTVVAKYFRAETNGFTLAHSTSPASNASHPATLTGGTDPAWTVIGK